MTKIKSLVPRSDFPAVEEYSYLNVASIGLMPMPVREALEKFSEKILYAGTASFDEKAEIMAAEGPRVEAAKLLNTKIDNIAIINSATEGLCQLAWAIRPKGNVVSINIEFPSATAVWKRVSRETGNEVRLVQAKINPDFLTIKDVSALVDKNTEVICVSHVQFANGIRFDLKKLAKLAHDNGALCIIDATQSAGVVPIDVKYSNIDALVAGGYKWLCGTFGAAILYISNELKEKIEPTFVGWRSMDNPYILDATRYKYGRGLRRYEYSTMSYAAGFALGKSISYIQKYDMNNVLKHAINLGDRLIKGLDSLGAILLTPRESDKRTGIVTARFPGFDGERIAAELNKRGVVVSPRFGATRFSAHLYNNSNDIDRALNILSDILNK